MTLILSNEEIRERYQSILNKNGQLLKLKKFNFEPLISIIILNRNGLDHLKRLFKDFKEKTGYQNFEIIVVDNASNDGSLPFLDKLSSTIPLKIIKNKMNETFSRANNQAVKEAAGEFILLLNNDVEPTYGWLNQLVQVVDKNEYVGAVGAKLIYPYQENDPNSFKIQHAGITFKANSVFIIPYNIANGKDPFDSRYNKEKAVAGVTGACLLVHRELYLKAGGLDEKYYYGYEDVDFSLKLNKMGYINIYCPHALLFHHENGKQKRGNRRSRVNRSLKNRATLRKKWGGYIRKNYINDKLNDIRKFSEQPLKAIIVSNENSNDNDSKYYNTTREIGKFLEEYGWNVSYQVKYPYNILPSNIDIIISLNPDIVISLNDIHGPNKIIYNVPSLIKIAWITDSAERWTQNPSLSNFDFIFSPNQEYIEFIKDKTGLDVHELPVSAGNDHQNYKIQTQKLINTLKVENVLAKIVIKIPAKSWRGIENCGDYHLALGLKKEFERKKCKVLLQIFPEWEEGDDEYDVVIVLRGLHSYKPKKHHFNIMWNISHPDLVSLEEYDDYDHVLVASDKWAEFLKTKVSVPVESMLQCTDPELFYPEYSREYANELLFVCNGQGEIRKMIKDLLPTDKNFGLFGTKWVEFIPSKYIISSHIPNISLHKAYSSSKILLNDHRKDMRDKGFISNRIFDGFASGAFIISDEIIGAKEIFGDSLITYSNKKDIHEKLDYYLEHEEERRKIALKGRKIVLSKHTFTKRVNHILRILN